MNLKKYYPYTPIYTVEENENTIIIYTTTPEKEMKTVYDLPMCGKQVIIKISTGITDDISSYFPKDDLKDNFEDDLEDGSKDKVYPWMDTNGNSKRLNNFIALCCKSLKDVDTLEHILTLSSIRLCPDDYVDIRLLTFKRSIQPPENNAVSSGRGRKTELDYSKLKKVVKKILKAGIPDKVSSDIDSAYSLFGKTKPLKKVSTHKPTLEEIQDYIIKKTDIGKVSLYTIHNVLQQILNDTTPSHSHPGEFPLYLETSGNFKQELLFDYQYHGNYRTWFEEYRTLELKPAKINIQGTTCSQILTEIKTKEEFTLTISAADFYDKYTKWRCDLNTLLRLHPYIGIENQTFYFSHADYIVKYGRFSPLPLANRYSIPLSGIRSDVKIEKLIYKGKCDFDMMNYIERGAIFNLEIPKEGTIEIGIGDCLRISTPNDNYLIPFLEITKHII